MSVDGQESRLREAWKCFHCGDVFETVADARLHFGADQTSDAACQIKPAGEFALLNALRNAENQLARYRAEDSDVLRAMYSMQADHTVALRRAEEIGYERGLSHTRSENERLRGACGFALGGLLELHDWKDREAYERDPAVRVLRAALDRAAVDGRESGAEGSTARSHPNAAAEKVDPT